MKKWMIAAALVSLAVSAQAAEKNSLRNLCHLPTFRIAEQR